MKKIILLSIACYMFRLTTAVADDGVLCKFQGMSDCFIDVALPGGVYNTDDYDTIIYVSGSNLQNMWLSTSKFSAGFGFCRVTYFCTGETELIPAGTSKRSAKEAQ